MDFHNSNLYALICEKADFDMLRKAEQVIALCNIEYYLEENCVGDAVSRYEVWQKTFPDGIYSKRIPITLQEVCRISDAEFCCMPWIYANVLQDLCADEVEPEEGEITAKTELDYITSFSNATWIWGCDQSYKSFDEVYTKFMSAEWIQDFLDKMEIPWPLTPAWLPKELSGDTIWPSEAHIVLTPKSKPIPFIPASPELSFHEAPCCVADPFEESSILSETSTVIEEPPAPAPSAEQKRKGPPKVRDAGRFWPFMRCKNVYKAYGGTGRLSHYDLLNWLADKFKLDVEVLKDTDPYTINGIKGLPRGYWGK